MIKTLTLDGLTSVTIKQSAYDMARFCWVNNRSDADVFASCVNADCTENADEVRRIPAGEFGMLDTESYETLYLNGSGTVEIVTTAFLVCPFGEGKKGGGTSLSGSASYTISNAVDYPLLGLSLYGKSVQDGTPTPETPIDIVSVGDNGFDIISKGDTHFNLLSVRDNGSEIITKQPVSAAVKIGVTAPFSVTATGTGLKYQWQILTKGSTTWKNSGSGGNTTDTLTASIDDNWRGAKVRCIVTDANGNREISNEAAIYVVSNDYEAKTSSIATDALPLCGIPVESGGNYTDSNGQMWICDELIYNADGTGKIIKRTAKIDSYNGESVSGVYISSTGGLDTGATVIYQIDTPQEIELTAADVSALMQLHTYNGMTNISNSGNADMDVKYCTDKALSEYVMPVITNMQAQIDELKSAVLSLGGNI